LEAAAGSGWEVVVGLPKAVRSRLRFGEESFRSLGGGWRREVKRSLAGKSVEACIREES
jgi:hypothetical protein